MATVDETLVYLTNLSEYPYCLYMACSSIPECNLVGVSGLPISRDEANKLLNRLIRWSCLHNPHVHNITEWHWSVCTGGHEWALWPKSNSWITMVPSFNTTFRCLRPPLLYCIDMTQYCHYSPLLYSISNLYPQTHHFENTILQNRLCSSMLFGVIILRAKCSEQSFTQWDSYSLHVQQTFAHPL